MTANWYRGNATLDGRAHRGWILGHFLDDADVRASRNVEVKWGIHSPGETRADWTATEHRTTVVILVKGRFTVELSTGTFELETEGDYLVWGPGIGHSWRAHEDTVIITVRWPSIPQ